MESVLKPSLAWGGAIVVETLKPNARRIQVRATCVAIVNKGERTSTSPLALGYPLLGPSRHVRAYQPLHAVVQPWLSLQRSISPWNVPALVLIVDCRFTHSMTFGVFCHCNYTEGTTLTQRVSH